MESQVAESTSRPRSIEFSSLSPEILLSIFLKLTSEDIVLLRRVCKKWLYVIDTNKLLWRNLEWIGKREESIEKAVEMFDEKSASSLEMVSIEEGRESFYGLREQITVVGRSKATLKSISVITFQPHRINDTLLELARSSPNLEKLVLWRAWEESYLPLTHLVPNKKGIDMDSPVSRLKVLWLPSSGEETEQILQLPLKSLISFALAGVKSHLYIGPLLAKFSETIAHLSLSITATSIYQMEQPLFCPNLKILEGYFERNLSLYFDCPNLKHLIFSFGRITGLDGVPPSVEQLWYSDGTSFKSQSWEALLSFSANMKIWKLGKEFLQSGGGPQAQIEKVTQVLEKRQVMIKRGERIQGLEVVPLQKLVLPLKYLSKDQLGRATKVVGEVIDIQDYPEFIELEY